METEITTERLLLRRVRPSDFAALQELVSDFEVVKMVSSWPYPADIAFTKTRIHPFPAEKGMIGPVFLGDELIGTMGVSMGEEGAGMGYMFARAHWGKGYATEIGYALIAHAWASYDWPDISASVFNDNPASARVLEKLGFVETGCGKGPCRARGVSLPMRNYRLTRPKP